ncbi:MAG: hypothetical protein RLZ98_2867, partial [Pseudomonadota bacterium]
RTYSTAFANERIDRFFSSLAAHGARHAEPIHIAVNLDGRQIAAAICIGTRKRLCVHILTYDQDYSRFAVGVHALEEVIRYGIANGMTCLDFLAPQSPFKADWTDTSVAVADYALAISPLGRAYFHGFIGVARPFARVLATWWSKRNRRKN